MNKNFCTLPWVHLSVNPDGTYRPCCLSQDTLARDDGKDHTKDGVTITDIWDSASMNNLRQQFLDGKRPEGCRYCWDLEDGNRVSKRMESNKRFHDEKATYDLTPDKPRYLDLKLGNICNLKCRICTPENSTKWIRDSRELKLMSDEMLDYYESNSRWAEDTPAFWDDLMGIMENVTHIDFAGGEPLLIKSHYNFLRSIVDKIDVSNIQLHYNTNGTKLPPADIINTVWSKFKYVELMISIDGVKEKFEYMRHGADWNKVQDNLKTFMAIDCVTLQICHTVNIFNVRDLPEYVMWAEENNISTYYNMLYHPVYYNIKSLPMSAKKKNIDKIRNFIDTHVFRFRKDKESLSEVASYMEQDLPENLIEFVDTTYRLDKHRDESVEETFPELWEEVAEHARPKTPDSFCVVPWTHTYVSPQGERRLCCASREQAKFQKQYIDADGNTDETFNPDTLDEHWNSDYMKGIRKSMLSGEKLSQCEVCNSQALNLHTYKKYFNETMFPTKIREIVNNTNTDGHTTMKPVSYDYRLNNRCNFKCRMCGEQLSSSWEVEKRKHNLWSPKKDKWMTPEMRIPIRDFQNDVLEEELQAAVDNGTIEEIYWVGGEPLMWDRHWSIMNQLVESGQSKDVTIRYNTNLSRIRKGDIQLYDLLPHFKRINVCASIDGTGAIGEYIRTGLKWDRWLNDFKQGMFLIDQFGDDAIVFDVTLTLPGLFNMKEMFDLVTELDIKSYVKITFSFDASVLMSPMALPRDVLDDILDDLIAYCEPKVTWKTQVYIDTFRAMKKRPVFEEEYNNHVDSFQTGKEQVLRLEDIRKQDITMDEILSVHAGAYRWWNQLD